MLSYYKTLISNGIELIKYRGSGFPMTFKCSKCGESFDKNVHSVKRELPRVKCPYCKEGFRNTASYERHKSANKEAMIPGRIKPVVMDESYYQIREMYPVQLPMKYKKLADYLCGQNSEYITISFKQIEQITNHDLPTGAIMEEFWRNYTSHKICICWLAAGYESYSVDLENKNITFKKIQE